MRSLALALVTAALINAALVPGAALAQAGFDKVISYTTRDSEIRDIVMSVGKLGGFNVMVDPKVRGKLPLQLKDVTCAEALKLVAGITGNKVGIIDGIVIFGTEETLKFMQGPARHRMFQLKYAKSTDVSGILNKVFQKDLSSVDDPKTNQVLVAPK